jgi:hypothetical protein
MFNTDKKYFPIKTDTACQSKWTWSTLWLTTGTTASCHRVRHLPIPMEDFDNFHNLPEKIKDRELMLAGQWPEGGCEYCRKIEDSGGSSDRQYHLTIPNLTPPELDNNPVATAVTPQIVEVFINNVCNLSCVYCRPHNSSKIQNENIKFGDFQLGGVEINNVYRVENMDRQAMYFKKFCQWLENNSSTLKQLHLLGGETFYQPELEVILDILEKGKNPDLELTIISNLMIKPAIMRKYIERIKKMCMNRNIGRLALTASIDGWGPEAEYARTGLDCKVWEENFAYIVSMKWINLHINQTITALTVRSVPDLIEKINYYRKQRSISQEFSLIVGTRKEYLHPGIFGGEFWIDDFKKILELMPEQSESDQRTKLYMTGIQSQVESQQINSAQLENFQIYFDELDRRRGTDWRKIYPYLDSRIKSILK